MRIFEWVSIVLVLLCLSVSCNNSTTKKAYYPNGTLKEEACFIHGKANGITKEYYPDGKLWIEALYKDGEQEGLTKIFFPNGNLQKLVTLHHGIVEDTQKLFYANGNLQEIAYVINGKKYGNIKMFYGNGRLKYKGNLIDGYQDSCWEKFDSITGQITNITVYKTDTTKKIFGQKLCSIDSTNLTLKMLDDDKLPFSVYLPIKWKLVYSDKNNSDNNSNKTTLLGAFDPTASSQQNEVLNGLTISKYPLKGATFSQFIKGNVKGLIENHQVIDSIRGTKLLIDGKSGEELIFHGQIGNEIGGLIITSILVGDNVYTINCYASKKDFPLYINLFREIISTLKFR